MKKLGLDSACPPIKLKTGSGIYVVQILDDLTDRAL
jgi:hypothetical protein